MRTRAIFLLLSLVVISEAILQKQTRQINLGTHITNNNFSVGTDLPWTIPSNFSCGGTPISLIFPQPNSPSDFLIIQGFGFSLPTSGNVTILDITVGLNRTEQTSNGLFSDSVIGLIKSIPLNYFSTTTVIGSTFSSYPINQSDVLWGTTWNSSDINSQTFGVLLQSTLSMGTNGTLYINCVNISVQFDAPAPVPSVSSTESNGKSSFILGLTHQKVYIYGGILLGVIILLIVLIVIIVALLVRKRRKRSSSLSYNYDQQQQQSTSQQPIKIMSMTDIQGTLMETPPEDPY